MIDTSLFSNIPLFFISPDIRRCLGLETLLPDFTIICANYHPIIEILKKRDYKVFCLEQELTIDPSKFQNTSQILSHRKVIDFIKKTSNGSTPHILYFKPNLKMDLLCKKHGLKKLANDYDLNEKFENKINSYLLLKNNFPENIIPGEVVKLKDTDFENLKDKYNTPFIIQFGHGWAGKTTFIITDKSDIESLQIKYPHITAKINKYIKGMTYLNNCCIYKDKVFQSTPAIQLSGILELSKSPFVTSGRQWPSLLDDQSVQKINDLTQKLGQIMIRSGFKGYFGLDFIIEDHTKHIFISEINARFTASAPFFTKLEISENIIPLYLYHIASFLDLPLKDYVPLNLTASQMIVRSFAKEDLKNTSFLKMGVYSLPHSDLRYLKEDYDIVHLNKEEIIIIPENKTSILQKDDEIARVELKDMVLNESGSLKNKYKDLINKIRACLESMFCNEISAV